MENFNPVKEYELVILGAGPAGLAAALEGAEAGAHVLVIDENPFPGGQIYRQPEKGIRISNPKLKGRDHKKGQRLFSRFRQVKNRVTFINNALVWGLFPGRELALSQGSESQALRFKKLIIAVGAYDRPIPFPGWTLPGVHDRRGGATNGKNPGCAAR